MIKPWDGRGERNFRWCPSIAWMKGRRSDVDRSRVEPGVQVGLPWSTQSPSSLLPWQACRAATAWAIQHPDCAEAPGIELPAARARIARGYFGFLTHAP